MISRSTSHLIFVHAIALMFLPSIVCGQNLVPNSDMESYNEDCPPDPYLEIIDDWMVPAGGGSTDYMHSCYNGWADGGGTPDNLHGSEVPYSGEGYIGFATWSVGYTNVKELMRVQLTEPLEADVEYRLSVHISLAEISSVATDKLYAHFSETDYSIWNDDENDLVEDCQVVFNGLHDISMDGWTYMQQDFIAEGGETFMTIGDFRLDELIDTLWLGWNNKIEPEIVYAYYYIDDVSLIRLDPSGEIFDAAKLEASIYPNPAKDELNVSADFKVQCASVVNLMGEVLHEVKPANSKFVINVAEIGRGYHLLVLDGEGHISVHPFVVLE